MISATLGSIHPPKPRLRASDTWTRKPRSSGPNTRAGVAEAAP